MNGQSGYRVEFLPVFLRHNAPSPPGASRHRYNEPCTEPFYISSLPWVDRDNTGNIEAHGDYFTFWYIGEIPANAVSSITFSLTGISDGFDGARCCCEM